jgi:phospholipase C
VNAREFVRAAEALPAMKRLGVLLILAMLAACNSPNSQSGIVPGALKHAAPQGHAGSYPITHVVIIVQENRSFDNFFRGFPKADSATFGYGHGTKYTLQELPLKWTFDLNHYHYQFLEDYDGGNNDGFDRLIRGTADGCKYVKHHDWVNHPSCWNFWTGKVYNKMAFSYVKKSDIQAYWTMASRYALGDHNFASTNGPSFGEHQQLIAGRTGHASEVPSKMPWGCDAPKETEYYLHFGSSDPPEFPPDVGHEVWGGDPCFTYKTVANLLDEANVTWRWYKQPNPTPSKHEDSFWLDAFDAIKVVRFGPDYKNVVTPDSAVLTDISNGNLAQVSWVMPHGGASDHPGAGSGDCGPAWVTSIVNAIGHSTYWKNTAIIIMWDEWGGWYDHVLPPQYPDPQTGALEGLGYRVPLIVVSPYAKKHYVSKSQHETASSLHFIEKIFGLPSLGTADARADAYDDVFDFSQKPTKFTSIPPPANSQTCASQNNIAPPEIDY